MSQHDGVCTTVVISHQKLGCSGIGEVANPAEDALLDAPGVGPVLEHLEIVVGLKQQDIHVLERKLHILGDIAKVSGDGHADGFAGSVEDKSAGVSSIVGNREGADFEVADAEAAAGLEELQ